MFGYTVIYGIIAALFQQVWQQDNESSGHW
jgi:hypothetical protein